MGIEAHHPMAVVTRRTGLQPDVIRAWERRHAAVRPSRSPGNRRLYTNDDIGRLLLIRRALAQGFRIGNVAALSDVQIETLLADEGSVEATPASRREATGDIDAVVERCLDHILALDDDGLLSEFESALAEFGRVALLERLMVPLMEEVGRACAEGRCRIANEHMATAVARSFLDSFRSAYPASDEAPGIVVTTPMHQHHELAALVVAATARSEGWKTTFLGANLPAEDIVAAVKQTRARAVALSITWPAEDPNLARDLDKLGRLLPEGVFVVAGGRSAGGYRDTLERIGAIVPTGLDDFRAWLQASSGASARRSVP